MREIATACRVYLIGICCVVVGSNCPFAENIVNAQVKSNALEIATHIEQLTSFSSPIHLVMSSEAKLSIDGGAMQPAEKEELEVFIDFENKTFFLETNTTVLGGGTPELPFRSIIVIDRAHRYDITYSAKSKKIQLVSGDIEITNDDWDATIQTCHFMMPFGYFSFGSDRGYIPQIVRNASSTFSTAILDGGVFDLKGEFRTDAIEIQLNSLKSWGIEKFGLERAKKSLMPGDFSKLIYTATDFKKFDKTEFPTSFRIESFTPGGKIRRTDNGSGVSTGEDLTKILKSREIVRNFKVLTFEEISRDRFQSAIAVTIPDNVPAVLNSAPHLRYTFKNGQFVPDVSKEAVEMAQAAKFVTVKSQFTWTRFILGLVTLTGIIAAIFVIFRRTAAA